MTTNKLINLIDEWHKAENKRLDCHRYIQTVEDEPEDREELAQRTNQADNARQTMLRAINALGTLEDYVRLEDITTLLPETPVQLTHIHHDLLWEANKSSCISKHDFVEGVIATEKFLSGWLFLSSKQGLLTALSLPKGKDN